MGQQQSTEIQKRKEEKRDDEKKEKEDPAQEERNRRVNAESQKLILLQSDADKLFNSFPPNTEVVVVQRMGVKQLPASLFILKNITNLDLSFNRLRVLPLELAELSNLIRLKYKSEKGHPENEISVVTKFSKLQFLDISWNNIPTIRFIERVSPSLTHFDVCNNGPLSEIPDLSHLTSLTYLNVSECFLRALPNLKKLPLLELHASYTLGLKQLPILPVSLTSLSAAEKIESIGVDIRHLTNLTHLNIRSNLIKEVQDLNGLNALKALTHLSLGPTQLKEFPDVLCTLHSLTYLQYGGMKNIKSLPEEFATLTNLQNLILRFNELSVFPTILFRLTRLTDLDLAGNEMVEVDSQIHLLSNLQNLNLTFNKLKTIPREVGQITTLQKLYIDENPLEDAQLQQLAKLGNHHKLISFLRTGEIPNNLPAAAANQNLVTNIPARQNVPPSPALVIPEGGSELTREELIDKIRGLVFGAALGDAVGLATEFLNKEQTSFIYGRRQINLDKEDFARDQHRRRWLTGDWTDDTDQLILILENIIEGNGELDIKTYALSLLKWAYAGFSELGDSGGMGIGQTVGSVLNRPEFLDDPHAAAFSVWDSTGRKIAPNGAVMRTGILGVPNFNNLEKVTQNTLEICKVTHTDPRCQASCVAVTVAIALMLQGEKDISSIIEQATESGKKLMEKQEDIEQYLMHMNAHVKDLDLSDRPKIGYTFKSLGCGFFGLREGGDNTENASEAFERAMMMITWEAGDADTNAAVAGALLGCHVGYNNLPFKWLNNLAHKDWLHQKVNVLLDLMGL